MNEPINNPRPRSLVPIVLIASIIGGLLVLGGQWVVDELRGDPTSIEGESLKLGEEQDADLLEAMHAAAQEAVDVEDGKYKDEPLEVAKIEVTAGNPHITAYRVILQPSG